MRYRLVFRTSDCRWYMVDTLSMAYCRCHKHGFSKRSIAERHVDFNNEVSE
jgi:hypothetical protein